jgi:hypothetical protein
MEHCHRAGSPFSILSFAKTSSRLSLSLPKTSSGPELLAVREIISHSALSSDSSFFRWFASHLRSSSLLSSGSSGV